MRRLLAEPLLHFILLGALLFAVQGWMRPAVAAGVQHITVSAGHVEHLALAFSRVWQRPPTTAELVGLVDDYVKEEILVRQALALGLERDDTVIRRRLRQKMEFVTEDLAATVEPTEAELEAYLRAHPDAFAEDPRISFRHVFLRAERAERLDADAAQLLATLRAAGPEADLSTLGDRMLFPGEFVLEPLHGVAAQFGSEFAQALDGVAVGEWSGPLPSAYGLHLVLIADRVEGRLPALDDVRDAVRRDFLGERRERLNRELLEGLLQGYEVTVEWSRAEDGASAPTTPAPASR